MKNMMVFSKGRVIRFLIDYGLLTLLFIIVTLMSFIDSNFLTQENLVSIFKQVSIIGIMAICSTFVILTGGIDLSVGPILAISGLLAVMTMQLFSVSTPLALLIGISIGMFLGLLNGLIISFINLPPIVVTLATMSIIKGIALLIGGATLHIIDNTSSFLIIGNANIGSIPLSVLIFLFITIIAIFLQKKTVFGISVLAIGDNPKASFLSGIKVQWTKTMTYILSGFGAGLSGIILASQVHTASATYGIGIELDVIAAIILGGTSLMGGVGNVVKTFYGVLFIGILNNALGLMNVTIEWQFIIKGLAIIFAITLINRFIIK